MSVRKAPPQQDSEMKEWSGCGEWEGSYSIYGLARSAPGGNLGVRDRRNPGWGRGKGVHEGITGEWI